MQSEISEFEEMSSLCMDEYEQSVIRGFSSGELGSFDDGSSDDDDGLVVLK